MNHQTSTTVRTAQFTDRCLAHCWSVLVQTTAAIRCCTNQRSFHYWTHGHPIAENNGRHDEQTSRFGHQELSRSAMPRSVFPSADTVLIRAAVAGSRTAMCKIDSSKASCTSDKVESLWAVQRCCLTQLWIQQSGHALPCFAPRILAYLGIALFHEHQLAVAEHSAYHLRSVVAHLDGLTVARTTKLTFGDQEDAEDEVLEVLPEPSHGMETEFRGGEGVDH